MNILKTRLMFLIPLGLYCLNPLAQANISKKDLSWAFSEGREFKAEERLGLKAYKEAVFSKSVSFEQRWTAVSKAAELLNFADKEDFLVKCLKQNEWFLKSPALKILKKTNPSLALIWAKKLIKEDKALVVRSDAVAVIRDLRDESASGLLWKELYSAKNFNGSSSLWIRPQIVKVLRKIEKNSEKEKWQSLLNDSDAKVQAEARKHIKLTKF